MRSSPILYYAFSMGATNRNWVFFSENSIDSSLKKYITKDKCKPLRNSLFFGPEPSCKSKEVTTIWTEMLEDSVKPLIHVQRVNWLCDISLGGVNKYNKNCSRMITVAGPELCRSTQPFVESYLYIQISEHIELIRQSVRHQFKMLWCEHMFKET